MGKKELIDNRQIHGVRQMMHGANRPPFIPCPICGGVEGCDHTVTERARAATQQENLKMSLGEDRVRIKFNPSDNSLVSQIKQKTAELIDLCGSKALKGSEEQRLWALAMTHYEDAAMWAVKAATI